MVYIDIEQNDSYVTLNCHKGTKDGPCFKLVIDAKTLDVIERPDDADIDVSTAYSHVCSLIRNKKLLPDHTVSAWG